MPEADQSWALPSALERPGVGGEGNLSIHQELRVILNPHLDSASSAANGRCFSKILLR